MTTDKLDGVAVDSERWRMSCERREIDLLGWKERQDPGSMSDGGANGVDGGDGVQAQERDGWSELVALEHGDKQIFL